MGSVWCAAVSSAACGACVATANSSGHATKRLAMAIWLSWGLLPGRHLADAQLGNFDKPPRGDFLISRVVSIAALLLVSTCLIACALRISRTNGRPKQSRPSLANSLKRRCQFLSQSSLAVRRSQDPANPKAADPETAWYCTAHFRNFCPLRLHVPNET